eukprot:3763813-Amphidinium_carterae.2
MISGGGCTQADATQAFVQPLLPEDVVINIAVPPQAPELRTEDQQKRAQGLKRPAFRLRRPLYGWGCAGNIWANHLEGTSCSLQLDPFERT